MNPHFQPYPELASPHSPSSDNSNYTTITGNGIGNNGSNGVSVNNVGTNSITNNGVTGNTGSGGGGGISNGSIINGANNGTGNSNNGMIHHQNGHNSSQQMTMDGNVQPNFLQLSNNNSLIKHCAGCGGMNCHN